MNHSVIDYRVAQSLDNSLKTEGHSRGLNLPNGKTRPSSSGAYYIQPILAYSDNINGGNSPEPLVLGNITFESERDLVRKEGVIAGFGAGLSGRYIHSEGRYFSYGINASYAHNSKHGLGITTTNAKLSSINHLKNWWYLDIHANTSSVRKEITDETNSKLSIVSSKIYQNGSHTFTEASFGVSRYFTNNYTQNQFSIGYDTISMNGVFTSLDLMLGEDVGDRLVERFSIVGRASTQLAGKPFTLTASYSKADGGIVMGFQRREETYVINGTYPIRKNIMLTAGYKTTNSTIDYFDVAAPTFSLQFASLNF